MSSFKVAGSGRDGGQIKNIIAGVTNGNLSTFNAATPMASICGAESLLASQKNFDNAATGLQRTALSVAVGSVNAKDFKDRAAKLGEMMKLSGMESFSQPMDAGAMARQKAATIELNTTKNRQWAAPENMFPSVYIPYNEETLLLPVDVAGVGAYNFSGNVHESFEDLRPIAAILADSKFNAGDDLQLVPVFPGDDKHPNQASFVPTSMWKPWDHTYGSNDLLGREKHKTNFLAIQKANNLMALCQAPGMAKFTNQDEIEQNSISLEKLLFGLKSKDASTEVFVALDTTAMAGRAMRPSTGVTSDDKREMRFPINGLNVKNLKDAQGQPTTAFASLEAAGLQVFVAFEFTATYHRSTRAWAPAVGPLSIAYVIDAKGNKLVPNTPAVPDDIAALLSAQAFEGRITGVEMYMNHNNVDRSRYGTTVVYANTIKPYSVHRRTPISVKYPMADDDANADILAMMIKQMDLVVTRHMSHDAMKAARKHFEYLYENRGQRIVSINDDSASIMPGQHFLSTTAVDAKVSLIDEVSTLDTKDTRGNIEEILVNKIYDIITALRVNSNIAALKELDGRDEEYVVVAHSCLAPFLMTTGDYRTFGTNIKFTVVETNIDSEIGTMWVFPKSRTNDSQIDIFGGLGICVTKELLVIEGTVQQSNTQYRMVITQPAYQHHALGCVAGRCVVADMDKLLGDEGIIAAVNKHLVKVSGKVQTQAAAVTGDNKEVPVEIG